MTIFNSPILKSLSRNKTEKKRPSPKGQSRSRWALALGTILCLSLLLSLHLLPDKVSLNVGDISDSEILAHKTVRYVDTVETERLRAEAAARVEKVYKSNPDASVSNVQHEMASIFDIIRRARITRELPSLSMKADYVKDNIRVSVNKEAIEAILALDDHTLDTIEDYAVGLLGEVMDREIREDSEDVVKARSEFRRRVSNYLGSAKYAGALAEIGSSVIRPNRIYDADATKTAQNKARESIADQQRQIIIGEVIAERNERITPEHIDKFTALGLRNPQVDYVSVICIALLVACVVASVMFYLYKYQHPVYASTKLLFLLSLIVVISVLGLKLGGSILALKLSRTEFGYLAMSWISLAGMLTAVLLNPRIAIVIVALLSTTSGLAMNHELRWALSGLLSSLVAIYAVSDIRHRSGLISAVAVLCSANIIIVWLVGRISGDTVGALLNGSLWAGIGGLGSIFLFWLFTMVLEKPFGITTHNRLVELSDTNNTMLKRLLMEAPGTYNHSIFVGNIAAAAADNIGADELLVRVASYYHDIGKIRRPDFFVENQYVENVHDRLNPSLSALVIRSHIKDGLELAKEYKLPPLIREMMSQHHGTSLVRYFYHQASSDGSGASSVLEQQFRYEGAKPQSKEAALLMLADAVEAASRCLGKPTLGQIEHMIDSVIHEKVLDGQLDESELTFKDISRIRNSFVRTLTSMMHARIEYPEIPSQEAAKVGGGNSGKEQPADTGEQKKADSGDQKSAAV